MSDTSSNPMHTQAGAPKQRSSIFLFFLMIAVVLALVGVFLMFQRRSQYEALAKNTETLSIPTVAIIHPVTEPGDENLVLPGTLQAYVESPIYARTNGYVKK